MSTVQCSGADGRLGLPYENSVISGLEDDNALVPLKKLVPFTG